MDRRYRLLVTLGLVIFTAPTLAQEQGAKPAVHAKSAMASSSNPTVTKAMVEVMKKGGTALDAVLTAVPMQAVIEPQMTTLAGGVSILYYDAKTKEYHYLTPNSTIRRMRRSAAAGRNIPAAAANGCPTHQASASEFPAPSRG